MIGCLLLGFGLGISIPYFIKLEVKKELAKQPEMVKEGIDYLPKDLLTEYLTGEEQIGGDYGK